MKKALITRHCLFQKLFGVFPAGSKFDKKFFLGALHSLLPTTPAKTLEIWRIVQFVCGFDIFMFLQKIDVQETIFRYGNFSIIKGKIGWPHLGVFHAFQKFSETFKQVRFIRCRRLRIWEKGNFCAVSPMFYRWDKNCRFGTKVTVFGI